MCWRRAETGEKDAMPLSFFPFFLQEKIYPPEGRRERNPGGGGGGGSEGWFSQLHGLGTGSEAGKIFSKTFFFAVEKIKWKEMNKWIHVTCLNQTRCAAFALKTLRRECSIQRFINQTEALRLFLRLEHWVQIKCDFWAFVSVLNELLLLCHFSQWSHPKRLVSRSVTPLGVRSGAILTSQTGDALAPSEDSIKYRDCGRACSLAGFLGMCFAIGGNGGKPIWPLIRWQQN